MGRVTSIAFTHHTFNPWWGCSPVSAGCVNCYAKRVATRFSFPQLWQENGPRRFMSIRYWQAPHAWNYAAERDGERRRVMCGSMCDILEDRRDLDGLRSDLWKLVEETPWLDWLLFTKRPENLHKLLPILWKHQARPNVWLIVTVENNSARSRLLPLLDMPAVVRGVSYEPALGPLDLSYYLSQAWWLDWVIAAGESGPKARQSNADWFHKIRDDCEAARVPFFFKGWGGNSGGRLLGGREHLEIPGEGVPI